MNPFHTTTDQVDRSGNGDGADLDYVDYTPRRVGRNKSTFLQRRGSPGVTPYRYNYFNSTEYYTGEANLPQHSTIPNQLTLSREKRVKLYHQLAALDDQSYMAEGLSFMDSPAVRRHLGVNERVVDIEALPKAFKPGIRPSERKENWTMDHFIVGENLGTGKFGTVYKAREKRSEQIVALKIMEKRELEEANVLPFLKREIEIQNHLDHPNITKLYGYFHTRNSVVLVMEYGGDSDLYTCLSTHKRFTEAETANFIVEIAGALAYMHRLGVIHRDLKLENILISREGNLKIADFGWAVFDPRPRRQTFCGTLDYLPPEMIRRESHTQAVDVWALGVICYELLVGRAPFEEKSSSQEDFINPERVYQRIVGAEIEFPNDISRGAREFILRLLERDPSLRLPMSAVETDPWIKSFLE